MKEEESHTRNLQRKVEKLAKENQTSRRRKTCRRCQEVELASDGVTFLPGGHFITCDACSETYEDCHSCGCGIMGTVKTFLS